MAEKLDARVVDELCDQFEADLRADRRPKIEDYLVRCPFALADDLLEHLVALEWDYLGRLDEPPTPDAYLDRFPEQRERIARAFFSSTESRPMNDPRTPADRLRETPEIPGVEILEEIGRGGMGVVFRGRDPSLRRELAVKVLQKRHADRPELARRFVEEVQITGQLQHPGIVPVHAIGNAADGRPYFAMKMVRGRTLAELLAARTSLADDLPAMVEIFEKVSETVAYAHSRGVIHRDLKPSNVMVGAFGEVQVMDWGLAKALAPAVGDDPDRPDPTPSRAEPAVATVRDEWTSLATVAGSALGTPSYMSPEQARGEFDRVDERSDVFGLGAILCVILTGEPPFPGDRRQAQDRAARGDLADTLARIDARAADPDLISLARRCLAPELSDRPRDAAEVARALAAHRQDMEERLRLAENERIAAEARAEEEGKRRALADDLALEARRRATEERRRRRATAGLATAVVAVMALCGGGLAWWQVRMSRADGLLDETARLCGEAERDPTADLSATQAALARAEEALGGLGSSGRLARTRELKDRAKRAAQTRVDRLLDEAEKLCGNAERDPEGDLTATRAAFDRALAAMGREPFPEHRERSSGLKSRMDQVARVRTLVDRLDLIRGQRDFDKTREATAAEYAKAFRDFGVDAEASEAAEAGGLLGRYPMKTEIAAAIDDWIFLKKMMGRKRESWSKLVDLAHLLDPDEARDYLRTNLGQFDLTELIERATPPRSESLTAASRVVMAKALESAGEPERAADLLLRGWEQDPGDYWICFTLGMNDWNTKAADRKKPEEATRFLTAAVALKPKYAPAYFNLGNALHRQGRHAEAGRAFRAAIRINPNDDLAHNNLGVALGAQRHHAEAEVAYREAIRLKPNEALAHNNLGVALHYQGHHGEAERAYREAIRLNPKFAEAHENLGKSLSRRGQHAEAERAFREVLRLTPNSAMAYCNLGWALRMQGDYAGALPLLRKGHELGSKQPGWRHPSARQLAETERLVAMAARLPSLLKGSEHPRDNADRLALAQMCYDTKRHAAAARFWSDAFEVDPTLGEDRRALHRYNAACAAALAAAGKGKDDPSPDDDARTTLREQALVWLKAEVAAWAKILESSPPRDRASIVKTLDHWKEDTDLASIRDQAALAKLPERQRDAFRSLWADVEALRKKAARDERPSLRALDEGFPANPFAR